MNTYDDDVPIEIKKSQEMRCIKSTLDQLKKCSALNLDETGSLDEKKLEELRCIRCCLERLLNHLNSQLFLDYQMEKFGRNYKSGKNVRKD